MLWSSEGETCASSASFNAQPAYPRVCLYYTTLHYTTLHYTILYYTILYHIILYYILVYIILYYTILHYTIRYYTILYDTIRYYTMQSEHQARWDSVVHCPQILRLSELSGPLSSCNRFRANALAQVLLAEELELLFAYLRRNAVCARLLASLHSRVEIDALTLRKICEVRIQKFGSSTRAGPYF